MHSRPGHRRRASHTCRVCGSAPLAPVIDLGDQCIAGAFAARGREHARAALPLELVRCDPIARPGRLRSGPAPPHRSRLDPLQLLLVPQRHQPHDDGEPARDRAQAVDTIGGLRAGRPRVDIGCNDGTLLDGYHGAPDLTLPRHRPLRRHALRGREGLRRRQRLLHRRARCAERVPDRKARVITSIAMFYDLEHPGAFVADVARLPRRRRRLGDRVARTCRRCSRRTASTRSVHEHLEYYSLAVIERLFGERRARGRSRASSTTSTAAASGSSPGTRDGRERDPGRCGRRSSSCATGEFELALDTAEPYEAFARSRSSGARRSQRRSATTLRDDGKRIHVYGASTKGNTILQYADIDRALIEYAADRNPDKWGSETIGTHIPIISEEESRALNPTTTSCCPGTSSTSSSSAKQAFFAGGGRFIVPLPEVRVLDHSNSS